MLPFILTEELPFKNGDYLYMKDIRKVIQNGESEIKAYIVGEEMKEFTLSLGELTKDERDIILEGCLINYYRK